MPNGIGNRQRDNWLPCLQVAKMAEDSWIEKCSNAIEELEIKRKKDTVILIVNDLLLDLREFLHSFNADKISNSDFLNGLLNLSDGD